MIAQKLFEELQNNAWNIYCYNLRTICNYSCHKANKIRNCIIISISFGRGGFCKTCRIHKQPWKTLYYSKTIYTYFFFHGFGHKDVRFENSIRFEYFKCLKFHQWSVSFFMFMQLKQLVHSKNVSSFMYHHVVPNP